MVISRDVVFDEAAMLKAHQRIQISETEKDISEQQGVQFELEVSDTNNPQSVGQVQQQLQQQESLAMGRPKRIIKPPERYGYKDMVAYALTVIGEDPSTFQEVVDNPKRDRWMEAMVEEMESLKKNKT